MKKIQTTSLLLWLLLPGLAWAQAQTPPIDELGTIAWKTMRTHSDTLKLPNTPQASTDFTIPEITDWGTLSVTFGAAAGDEAWTLQSYAWRYEDQKELQLVETSAFIAPPNPDPDPPNPDIGSPGDARTSSFRIGDWVHTVSYTFAARDGVLGWQTDSIDARYKPRAG